MKRFFWSFAVAVVIAQSALGVEHLKQSTAVTIKFGPFVDDADGVTAEGSLTLSQSDFRLSKNGGNIAQKNDATAGTHDELGFYDVPLDATDTNTLGRLLIAVSETGALPVWKEYMVLPANVYDSLYGSDKLEVDVTTWNGTAVATPDTAGYPKVTIKDGTGTGEIDTTSGGVALATGQEIEVADADLRSALGMAAADLDTQLDAIVADTNELQTDWVNGGRLDLLIDSIKAATDLLNSAQAEPTGVPAANETPLDKLAYVYMMLRNKITVTADTKTYFDDGGAAEFKKGLTDDGTTYTEAEAAAP